MADFAPARRTGLILHILSALLLGGGSGLAVFFATQQRVGVNFVLMILAAVVLFLPLPLVLYRGYALLTARYSVDRDGLKLRWGLRAEDIPLPEIEWLRPASDLAYDLPVPRLSWPGALLGVIQTRDLGPVEYLASNRRGLLLVATPQRVFAISPADTAGFARAFRSATEMGSLAPIQSFSAKPVAFLLRVWGDRTARVLVLAGFILAAALFVLVSLTIPARASVSLGFNAAGQPLEPGPPAALLLLPVLAIFAFVADLVGGLFFYRREDQRPVAYLLWAGSVITPVMLILATLLLT